MVTKRTELNDQRPINDFFRSRLNRWIILVSLICSIGVYLFFLSFKPIKVFPSGNEFKFVFFTDTANGGHSQIFRHSVTDSSIEMEYVLKRGFVDPYASISISHQSDTEINISLYNRLIVDIQGCNTSNIGFDFNIPFASGFSNLKDTVVDFYYNIINLSSQRKQYTIDLQDLKVPDYWYVDKNLAPNIAIHPNFKHVLSFNIGTAYATQFDTTQKFRLYEVRFERDNSQLILFLLLIELLIIVILFIIYYIKNYLKSRSLSLTITYKPVEVHPSNTTSQNTDLLNYINSNFHNPELSLEKVANKLRISQRLITSTIHNTYGCNFKSYINQLRIHESKRLLKESNLSMGEIAIKVGFNTQSHFNRVFKSVVGISPTDFKDADY